jgi:hypothetical protein
VVPSGTIRTSHTIHTIRTIATIARDRLRSTRLVLGFQGLYGSTQGGPQFSKRQLCRFGSGHDQVCARRQRRRKLPDDGTQPPA